MKLLLVPINYYIFLMKFIKFFIHSQSIKWKFIQIFNELNLFYETIPKVRYRFYVNIRNYTQYMTFFFLIIEILSKLMMI
jgi:hypothetical protein